MKQHTTQTKTVVLPQNVDIFSRRTTKCYEHRTKYKKLLLLQVIQLSASGVMCSTQPPLPNWVISEQDLLLGVCVCVNAYHFLLSHYVCTKKKHSIYYIIIIMRASIHIQFNEWEWVCKSGSAFGGSHF